MDPRTLDTRSVEDQLREWDPEAPRLSPTILKCTRCGHETHASAVA